MSKRIEILEVLVGSRAHGIARVNSDEDIRGVFITPTSELLKIGSNEPQKGALSSNGDNYKYEIAHFLQLAIKSNPSILEIFKAPIRKNVESCAAGIYSQELRDLFPHVWSSIGVRNAFKGYSHDQQKRMFDERDQLSKRRFKYAVAHIRVLLQGIELLREGDFSVAIKENYYWADYNTDLSVPVASETDNDGIIIEDSWIDLLRRVRDGKIVIGQVVDVAEYLKHELDMAYEYNPNKQTNMEPVNEFLLKVRKEFW